MATISFIPYVIASIFATYYASPFQIDDQFTLLAFIVKVTPVLYLLFYVNSYLQNDLPSDSTSKKRESDDLQKEMKRLVSGVSWALIFSVMGDAFLFRYKNDTWFLWGIGVFSLGHICYIQAFGFRVTRKSTGVPLYSFAALASLVIVPNAPMPFKVIIPLYGFLLATMVWRALDRSAHDDGRSEEQKLSLTLGAALFLLSDLCIGLFKYVLTNMHYTGEYIIMATYYIGQGLIVKGVT